MLYMAVLLLHQSNMALRLHGIAPVENHVLDNV